MSSGLILVLALGYTMLMWPIWLFKRATAIMNGEASLRGLAALFISFWGFATYLVTIYPLLFFSNHYPLPGLAYVIFLVGYVVGWYLHWKFGERSGFFAIF